MKRLSLIISAIILSSISLSAQIIETVYTTKGDIYEGFISEQNPGKYIIVYAEKAILSAPKAEVSNLRKEYRPDNTLTYTAIRFLEEKSVQSDALFYTFEYNGQIIDNVYVLEDNDEQIKYVSFAHRSYRIPWNELLKTTKEPNISLPYGIKDKVLLKTAEEIYGTIVEQEIGKSLTIMTFDNVVKVIPIDDVFTVRMEPIDQKTGLWTQTQMLDRVVLKDGEVLEGFVVARVLGQKITIRKPGDVDVEQSVPMNEISLYQKFWNKNFVEYMAPVYDLRPFVKINGRECTSTRTYTGQSKRYVIDPIKITVNALEIVKIDLQNTRCDRSAQVYRAEATKFVDKNNPDLNGKTYAAIRIDDEPVYESRFIRVDEAHTNCEVIFRKPGTYFLSIKGVESVFVFEVK